MSLNLSLWIWIALAVMAAWVVGAYSRLLRLRQSAEQARSSLRKYLLRSREMAGNLNEGTAFVVMADMRQVSELTEQWGRDPKPTGVPSGLGDAIDRVEQNLVQLLQQPEDLAGAVLPEELMISWNSLMADIAARRTRYNVHVSELNEALLQMPASVLARIAGMQIWESL